MRRFASPAELIPAIGQELGVSDWQLVDQARIDAFAEATGDRQWIHVDRARAAASPLGATIAHGFLTLSLLPSFTQALFVVEGVPSRLNYGLDRVRFVAPVPSGSRLRGRVVLASAETRADGTTLVALDVTIELEDSPRPACVARQLVLLQAA
jgi:acyl dehydratase